MTADPDDTRNRQDQDEHTQQDEPPTEMQDGPPTGQGDQPTGQPAEQGRQPARQPAGQPPGQQTQRGGQPAGQAYRQPAATGPSLLQEWVIYIAALSGLAGGGFGFVWVIIDAIDQPVFQFQDTGFGSSSIGLAGPSLQVVLVAVVAAVVTGVWLGRTIEEDDQTTFKIAGAAVAAGTAAFMLLSLIFVSVTLEDISVAFGGLLINTIITALFAAGLAAAGVWLSRNQYPSVS
jgi:hypothetical protein